MDDPQASNSTNSDDKQPIEAQSSSVNVPYSPEQVQQFVTLLSTGQLGEGRGRIRWSSNYTFLVSVCEYDDSPEVLAIYKPRSGERPLWDFPDGTLCLRERAAFLISEALGWQIVPPTVLRDGPRGFGSVQLYIEHNPEITYFNFGESFIPQIQRIATFDAITNNADRKGGHCILGENNKIWGIDHGICFHVAPKLRTVIWEYAASPIPNDIKQDIINLKDKLCKSDDVMATELRKLISEQEMKGTAHTHRAIANEQPIPRTRIWS